MFFIFLKDYIKSFLYSCYMVKYCNKVELRLADISWICETEMTVGVILYLT